MYVSLAPYREVHSKDEVVLALWMNRKIILINGMPNGPVTITIYIESQISRRTTPHM